MTDDGFLSLMSDDGSTKEDVKLPDGEVGDKISKLFTEEGKDTSKCCNVRAICNVADQMQTSLFSLLWVRRLPLTPRRLPRLPKCSVLDGLGQKSCVAVN